MHSAESLTTRDPAVPDWDHVQLPPGWPDALNVFTPRGMWVLITYVIASMFQRSPRATLPKDLPQSHALADYMLHSFHGLPNGYFSEKVARTYTTGFELALLGRLPRMRRWLADAFRGCKSVLDVGCGSGALTSDVAAIGVTELWGVDPVPYVLKVAAERLPQGHFVPGAMEALPFPNERFDGAGILYVMHEVPREINERAVKELFRVLKPGGVVAILEPARYHLHTPWWKLLFRGEIAAIYFKVLATLVWEPYLKDWKALDPSALFRSAGFVVESEVVQVPFIRLVARKPA